MFASENVSLIYFVQTLRLATLKQKFSTNIGRPKMFSVDTFLKVSKRLSIKGCVISFSKKYFSETLSLIAKKYQQNFRDKHNYYFLY